MKPRKTVKMPLRRAPRRAAPAKPLRARAAAVEEPEYDEDDYDAEDEPNMKLSHAFIVVLVLHLVAVGGIFAFNSIKSNRAQSQAATTENAAPEAAPTPVSTVAAREPEVVQKPNAPAGKTHTVQAGDTLTRIATLHKTTVEALEQENGITTYSLIRVGQVLKIPDAKTAAPSSTAAPKPAVISAVPKPPATEQTTTAEKFIAIKNQDSPAKTEASPKAATTAVPSGDVYVVEKGDNPYSIAKKLSVSYSELLSINNIDDPTKLQIGQKLKIPTKSN